VLSEAVKAGGIDPSRAACLVFDLPFPKVRQPISPPRLGMYAGGALAVGITFAVRIKFGLHDSWEPAVAMGVAVLAIATSCYWWIGAPARWSERP
jgi:hypothetical protein